MADIIRDRKSGIINLCQRRESLRNGNGCGIAVEIVDDTELNAICRLLAEKLDLDGVVNAEFFKTLSGYKVIEINPRFSAGTMFSCMSGVNTVCDAFSIANNMCIQKTVPAVGKRYAKRYETYEL